MFYKIFVLLFLSVFSYGLDFFSIDPKTFGMGGAGVSSASREFAYHYNPALLASNKKSNLADMLGKNNIYKEDDLFTLLLSSTVTTNLIEVAENISSIEKFQEKDSIKNISNNFPENPTSLQSIINGASVAGNNKSSDIKSMQKILSDIYALNKSIENTNHIDFLLTWQNIGFAIATLSDLKVDIHTPDKINIAQKINDAYVKFDPSNDTYTKISQSEYNTNANLENINEHLSIDLNALVMVEFPLSYAHSIHTKIGDVYLGATTKLIGGAYHSEVIDLSGKSAKATLNKKLEYTFGVDVGTIYRPIKNISIGMVVKNLNTPSFNYATGKTFKMEPMMRAGASYRYKFLELATDMDISTNKTISGVESQNISAGVDLTLNNDISLRTGLYKNIALSNSPTNFTLGLHLFILNLSTSYSSENGMKLGFAFKI